MTIKGKSKKDSENQEHQYHPPHDDSGHGDGGHDESNWLVSYADMMTLLCGFFILLFSMAKLEAPKYDSFKQAMSKQFGGEYVSPTKELAKYATQVIEELGIETPTIIKADENGISIVFESTLFFETMSADVSPNGKKILTQMIKKVAERQKNNGKVYKIVVEGHTDSRPIISGMYPSNWELSGARAARVVRMFLDAGFLPNQLTAIGYADTQPRLNNRTYNGKWDEQALAKNRRVVLRILEPNIDAIPFPDGEDAGSIQTTQVTSPASTPHGSASQANQVSPPAPPLSQTHSSSANSAH